MPKFATAFIDDALRQEVAFFRQWGFLVVEDALTKEQVARLSCGATRLSEFVLLRRKSHPAACAVATAALDKAYDRTEGDKRTGGGAPDPDAKDHFIHNVLEEDDDFAFLLDNPPVLLRMRAILGSSLQLHSATARYVSPGMPDQQWHRDGQFPVAAPGTTDYRFGQINCGYYLDELTPELGPTMVVPGSYVAATVWQLLGYSQEIAEPVEV
eukprot:SAG31_NODE_427_length_15813_cov_13.679649_5_plen_212_part_00